jgi:hypothetical protein
MSNHRARLILNVLVALAGEIALVVVLKNINSSLAFGIFLVYAFWIPAWFFCDPIMAFAPEHHDAGRPLILMPIFLPLWAAVVVLLWIPTQTLTRDLAVGLVVLSILVSTAMLLWRSAAIPLMHPRKVWNSSKRQLGWLGLGIVAGIVWIFAEAATVNDLTFSPPSVGNYSSLYLLPDQDFSIWGDGGARIEDSEPFLVGIGIANHEGMTSDYVIVITQGEEHAIAEINPITLTDGAIWEGSVRLDLQPDGDHTVYVFLERVGFPWPYRQLVIQW